MKGKIFVDSNVLIYLFSRTEPTKRELCQNLVSEYNSKNLLVWSTQVIQEFYSVMTKKNKVDPLKTKSMLKLFDNFELVVNDRPIIERAIEIQVINQFSFWDSLVLSSALSSNCNFLLTEDLTKGQRVESVQLISPFDIIIE